MNEYENLKKGGAVGFAHGYLHQCDKKSKTGDEIDIQVYTKLVKLDSKIGTTALEQLYWCLQCTTRSDIIEVLSLFLIHAFKSFQTINFEQVNDYEELRKGPHREVGYAHAYLRQLKKKSKSDDEIDIQVYTKLVELDSKIGTTASEQLFWCLQYTTRSDIIEVLSLFLIHDS